MSRPLLIVISGHPCTGKTYLGNLIAKKFKIPFISKDDIAELIFDSLQLRESEWSQAHRGASYAMLYFIIETFLKVNSSIIVESAFDPKYDNKKFQALIKKYSFKPIQIYLKAKDDIVLERYTDRYGKREEVGKSHPMHFAYLSPDKLREKLKTGKHSVLDIGGDNYEIDTSDFSKVRYKNVIYSIKKFLKN